MALKHHWKFSNNLQDSVGDVHLVNVKGTEQYTSNKDGIINTALDAQVDIRASSEVTTEFGEIERSYSLWCKKSNSTNIQTIFSDNAYQLSILSTLNTTQLKYRTTSSGYASIALSGTILTEIVEGEWFNLIITTQNNGVKKIFLNGVLKLATTTTIAIYSGVSVPFSTMLDPTKTLGSIFQNRTNIDEVKYFDHILTDGNVTTIGQSASLDSEVWQLYIAGVNNIPAYTLNPATEITGTSAKLTWNES